MRSLIKSVFWSNNAAALWRKTLVDRRNKIQFLQVIGTSPTHFGDVYERFLDKFAPFALSLLSVIWFYNFLVYALKYIFADNPLIEIFCLSSKIDLKYNLIEMHSCNSVSMCIRNSRDNGVSLYLH